MACTVPSDLNIARCSAPVPKRLRRQSTKWLCSMGWLLKSRALSASHGPACSPSVLHNRTTCQPESIAPILQAGWGASVAKNQRSKTVMVISGWQELMSPQFLTCYCGLRPSIQATPANGFRCALHICRPACSPAWIPDQMRDSKCVCQFVPLTPASLFQGKCLLATKQETVVCCIWFIRVAYAKDEVRVDYLLPRRATVFRTLMSTWWRHKGWLLVCQAIGRLRCDAPTPISSVGSMHSIRVQWLRTKVWERMGVGVRCSSAWGYCKSCCQTGARMWLWADAPSCTSVRTMSPSREGSGGWRSF
jgi:hypothetical protein